MTRQPNRARIIGSWRYVHNSFRWEDEHLVVTLEPPERGRPEGWRIWHRGSALGNAQFPQIKNGIFEDVEEALLMAEEYLRQHLEREIPATEQKLRDLRTRYGRLNRVPS